MSKRRAYDVTLKLRQSSTWRRLAARHFTVDAKRIREWCGQKEQLVEGSSSSNDWCPHRLVNMMASKSYNALHFISLTSDLARGCAICRINNNNNKYKPGLI